MILLFIVLEKCEHGRVFGWGKYYRRFIEGRADVQKTNLIAQFTW